MRTRHTSQRFQLLIILVLVVGSAFAPAFAGAADEPPRLEVGRPTRVGAEVVTDVSLIGLFDADLVATLRSGLPVNLIFKWTIRRERAGWRDEDVASGQLRFRIFFDMLEDDYNIFSAQGRPLASCDAVGGVEDVVCNRQGLVLGGVGQFVASATYYAEIEARVEAVTEQQIQGFEAWLLGATDVTGGPAGAPRPVSLDPADEGDGLAAELAGFGRDLVRRVAGIRDKTARGKSASFSGW